MAVADDGSRHQSFFLGRNALRLWTPSASLQDLGGVGHPQGPAGFPMHAFNVTGSGRSLPSCRHSRSLFEICRSEGAALLGNVVENPEDLADDGGGPVSRRDGDTLLAGEIDQRAFGPKPGLVLENRGQLVAAEAGRVEGRQGLRGNGRPARSSGWCDTDALQDVRNREIWSLAERVAVVRYLAG